MKIGFYLSSLSLFFLGSYSAVLVSQDLIQRHGLKFILLVRIPTHICALFPFPPSVPQHPHRVQNFIAPHQTADPFNPFQILACSWAEKLTETQDDGERSARVHSVASNLGSLVLEWGLKQVALLDIAFGKGLCLS